MKQSDIRDDHAYDGRDGTRRSVCVVYTAGPKSEAESRVLWYRGDVVSFDDMGVCEGDCLVRTFARWALAEVVQ